jgi:hypothetical protein
VPVQRRVSIADVFQLGKYRTDPAAAARDHARQGRRLANSLTVEADTARFMRYADELEAMSTAGLDMIEPNRACPARFDAATLPLTRRPRERGLPESSQCQRPVMSQAQPISSRTTESWPA